MKNIFFMIAFGSAVLLKGNSGTWVRVTGPRTDSISIKRGSEFKSFIAVVINGEEHRALVDTGGVCVVDLALARHLGLNLVETNDVPAGLSGTLGKHWLTTVNLALGEIKVANFGIGVIDLSSFHESVARAGEDDFDLIIGADLLALLDATIDFKRNLLTLHIRRKLSSLGPNQSLEPTGIAGTPSAGAEAAPATPVAHH